MPRFFGSRYKITICWTTNRCGLVQSLLIYLQTARLGATNPNQCPVFHGLSTRAPYTTKGNNGLAGHQQAMLKSTKVFM